MFDHGLTRLLDIYKTISRGERPTAKELALEYDISVRTIQKDLNERLYDFGVRRCEDDSYRYTLANDSKYFDNILNSDEMMMLSLGLSNFSNINDLDKISKSIIDKVVHHKLDNPFHMKLDDMQDIEIQSPFVQNIEKAILENNIIQIEIKNKKTDIVPYKISNIDGFWYILGKDLNKNKFKVYMLKSIESLIVSKEKDPQKTKELDKILKNLHSEYFQDGELFQVMIKVYKEEAYYFKEKDFLTSQKIIKENKDGSLIVTFDVTHDEDVDNIIKSRLPHIEVIEPLRFRDKIKNELMEYINKIH